MKHYRHGGIIAASVGLLLVMGTVAGIAQDKSAVLKERQDFMKGQANDLKPISAFAKGEGEQGPALTAVNDLLARNAKIVDFFPPGTSNTDFPGKTDAKPEIWQNWDKFKAVPAVLKTEEDKLADAIKSGDKQAVGTQLAAMGKNGCGACHGPYRVPPKT
jgi:cytochrome c556